MSDKINMQSSRFLVSLAYTGAKSSSVCALCSKYACIVALKWPVACAIVVCVKCVLMLCCLIQSEIIRQLLLFGFREYPPHYPSPINGQSAVK